MAYRELTAAEITKEALLKLKARGCVVWRNATWTAGRRRNIVKRGISDVIGYTSKGLFVACEVKTDGDVFSEEQIDFLNGIKSRGGIALWATQFKDGVIIKSFEIVNGEIL